MDLEAREMARTIGVHHEERVLGKLDLGHSVCFQLGELIDLDLPPGIDPTQARCDDHGFRGHNHSELDLGQHCLDTQVLELSPTLDVLGQGDRQILDKLGAYLLC